MKNKSKLLALALVLLFTTIACLGGGGGNDDGGSGGGGGKSGEVMDAVGVGLPKGNISNLTVTGNSVNFQVDGTSIDEMVSYYRGETQGNNLTERTLLTSITDTAVNLVFDGHSSGKALVIQMVDLGEGTINVNIRLEDV